MIDVSVIKSSIKSTLQLMASDENFKNNNLIDRLYEQYSVNKLFYSAKDSSKNDGEREFTMNDVPDGFPFIPGRKYPYVSFNYAVNGNPTHLALLGNSTSFRTNGINFNPHNNQKYFVFTRYSKIPFIGNDKLIETINNEATQKKEFILQELDQFNKMATQMNIELRKFIEEEFEIEKNKRLQRKDSLDKLNPF